MGARISKKNKQNTKLNQIMPEAQAQNVQVLQVEKEPVATAMEDHRWVVSDIEGDETLHQSEFSTVDQVEKINETICEEEEANDETMQEPSEDRTEADQPKTQENEETEQEEEQHQIEQDTELLDYVE